MHLLDELIIASSPKMVMIFGVQLLSTLIIGLFMTKIFSSYSYGLLIFYNVWFCVPPSTGHLGEFSQAYKDHMKKKPRNGDKKTQLEDFTIPKDSDFKARYNRIISYTQIKLLPHNPRCLQYVDNCTAIMHSRLRVRQRSGKCNSGWELSMFIS